MKQYKINYKKVKTIKDVKAILELFDFTLTETPESDFSKLTHFLEEIKNG